MGLEEDERVKEQLLTGGLKIAKESIIAETRWHLITFLYPYLYKTLYIPKERKSEFWDAKGMRYRLQDRREPSDRPSLSGLCDFPVCCETLQSLHNIETLITFPVRNGAWGVGHACLHGHLPGALPHGCNELKTSSGDTVGNGKLVYFTICGMSRSSPNLWSLKLEVGVTYRLPCTCH